MDITSYMYILILSENMLLLSQIGFSLVIFRLFMANFRLFMAYFRLFMADKIISSLALIYLLELPSLGLAMPKTNSLIWVTAKVGCEYNSLVSECIETIAVLHSFLHATGGKTNILSILSSCNQV